MIKRSNSSHITYANNPQIMHTLQSLNYIQYYSKYMPLKHSITANHLNQIHNTFNSYLSDYSYQKENDHQNVHITLSNIKEELSNITKPLINTNKSSLSLLTEENQNRNNSDLNKSIYLHRNNTTGNNLHIKPYVYTGGFVKSNNQLKQIEIFPLKVFPNNSNINENKSKVDSLSKAWNCLENKVTSLQDEIEKLNKDNSRLTTEYNTLLTENNQIKKQIDGNILPTYNDEINETKAINQQLKQKDKIIQTLQKYITKTNEILTETNKKEDCLNKENLLLKQVNKKLLKENKLIKKQLNDKIQLMNEKENGNIQLKDELTQTKEIINKLYNEQKHLLKKVNTLTSQKNELLKKLNYSNHKSLTVETNITFTLKVNRYKQLKHKYKIQNITLFTLRSTPNKKKEKALTHLKEQKNLLQNELNQLKEQNMRLLNETNQQKEQTVNLQKESNNMKEQNAQLKEHTDQLKEQNNQLQTKFNNLQIELRQIKEEYNTNFASLNVELFSQKNNIEKLQSSLTQSEELQKTLINEKEILNDKVFDLENRNTNLQSKHKEINLLNNQLLSKNSSLESEITSLNSQIKELSQQKIQIENKLKENNNIKNNMQSELNVLHNKIVSLTEANKKEAINEMEYKKMQHKLTTKTNLLSQLQTQNEQLLKTLNQNEEVLKTKDVKINEISIQLNTIKTELEKEVNENTQLKDEILELLSNDEKIANDLLNLNSLKKDLESKIFHFQNKVNSLQNQIDLLQNENSSLKNQNELTNKEKAILQTKYNDNLNELNNYKEQNLKMQMIIDDKENKSQALLDLLSKLDSLNFISSSDSNNLETEDNDDILSKFDTISNLLTLSISEYKELDALVKLITDYKEMLLILKEEKDKNDLISAELDKIKKQNFDLISQKQELSQKIITIEDNYKQLLMSDKYVNNIKSTNIDVFEVEGMKLQVTTLQQYIRDKEKEIHSYKEMIQKEKEQAMILKIQLKQMQMELNDKNK